MDDIVVDGLEPYDSDESIIKFCVHAKFKIIVHNIYKFLHAGESHEMTADSKSQFALIPEFKTSKPKMVVN